MNVLSAILQPYRKVVFWRMVNIQSMERQVCVDIPTPQISQVTGF